jgi:hypothetical protein
MILLKHLPAKAWYTDLRKKVIQYAKKIYVYYFNRVLVFYCVLVMLWWSPLVLLNATYTVSPFVFSRARYLLLEKRCYVL